MEVETDPVIETSLQENSRKFHFESILNMYDRSKNLVFYNIRLIQQQNGMKHSDFSRYRQFCSRKLRRVRKRVGLIYSKGKNFIKKPFEASIVKDAGSLFIPLLETERAWAYAMEIKQDLREKENHRGHFHVLNRLKKACHSALLLKTICDQTCDTDTCLEAEAYQHYLDGVYNIEIDEYAKALECFTRCNAILTQLRDICISLLQSVYTDKIKDLEPYIRYCNYNLQKTGQNNEDLIHIRMQAEQNNSVLQMKIQRILDEKHNQDQGDLSIIQWNELKVPVEDEQIRIILLKIRDNETELCDISKESSDRLLDSYSTLFSSYDQATRLISHSMDKISKSAGSSTLSNRNITIYNTLFIYIKYMKLLRVTERNIFLFNLYNDYYIHEKLYNHKKLTPNDLITIITAIMHNLKDMNLLLTPSQPEETLSPTNQNYLHTNEYLFCLYRAWRAYYASNLYVTISSYKEASLLCEATEELLNHLKELKNQFEYRRVVSIDNSDLLTSLMTSYPIELHANATLNKIPIQESSTANAIKYSIFLDLKSLCTSIDSDTNLLEKLDDVLDITSNVTLFEIPPKMTPLTTKPLFFDVLVNEMNYSKLHFKKYLQANTSKPKTSAPKDKNPSTGSAATVEEPKSSGYGWFKWF